MLLRYFYDEKLAHASYMVGCEKTGRAVIIDPMRHIEPYVKEAEKKGMEIVGALETHIHADFVSGARELADRLGATVYLSDEGGENWAYQNLDDINHTLLKGGDRFEIGALRFEVLHTPGHTPESISFVLTDGGKVDEPIGIFTGDFLLFGGIGRPDILEESGGDVTAEEGAKALYQSIERFKQMDDYLQVWPAHGAGSSCGKSGGDVPSSTVGYEKRFNWAFQFDDEADFVQAMLAEQPEVPTYFAHMKAINQHGPKLAAGLPRPELITETANIEGLVETSHQVIDTRDAQSFSERHLKGTINIPFNESFPNWMGWLMDYDEPLYLLVNPFDMDDLLIALRSIGIDEVAGYLDVRKVLEETGEWDSYMSVTPEQAKGIMETEDAVVLDVRGQNEYEEGHIEGAMNIMVGTLKNRLHEVPGKKLIVHCQAGKRSAIAVSILKANGYHNLVNMAGGYAKWQKDMG
ncbi:MAG: rhodanese-like domain-containing protein [Lysinibacillus sp.]